MLPKFGSPRLKFPAGKQRKFIESVFIKSGLSADALARIASVSPRTIRDWKREKFHITKMAVDIFCKEFSILSTPQKMDDMIESWKVKKLEISRKGGLIYYEKYGLPGSVESRRRGGIAGLAKIRKLGLAAPVRKFNSPKYSKSLAEFVGIMLGDGSIGKLQISIILNSLADAEYSTYVLNLCNKLFGCYPKVRGKKNCNALDIYYNGINLIKYLIKIGMLPGNKVKQQVDVPGWIKRNPAYRTACLRGLMDTDGGVFVHKYEVNGKEYLYKKICFTNRSIPILRFVYNSLNNLGFAPKIVDNVENKKVWLYNTHEVSRYLEVVRSNNQRLNRYITG